MKQGRIMYEVHSDSIKNLIHLKMAGFLNEDEIGKGADEVLAKLKSLKPGFVFINDVGRVQAHVARGRRAHQARAEGG